MAGRTTGGRGIGPSALLDEEQRETVAVLDQLVRVHLVEEPTRGRYWFHDLTRAYARERFDVEEDPDAREATVRRMFDWWLHAVRAANEMLGFGAPYSLTGEIGAPTRPTPVLQPAAARPRTREPGGRVPAQGHGGGGGAAHRAGSSDPDRAR